MNDKYYIVMDQRGGRTRPVCASKQREAAHAHSQQLGGDHYVLAVPACDPVVEAPTSTAHHFEVVARREGFYVRAVNEEGAPETPWSLTQPNNLGRFIEGVQRNITGLTWLPEGRP